MGIETFDAKDRVREVGRYPARPGLESPPSGDVKERGDGGKAGVEKGVK